MLLQPTVRRRTVLATLVAAATPIAQAAADRVPGSGPVRVQIRRLDPFTGVALALPAQVELRTGAAEGITIETNENLLPLIETTVENGSLQIRPVRHGLHLAAGMLKIVVTARRIDSLALAGTGAISAASLRAPRLNLQLGGTGSMELAGIECDSLAASLAGSGRIALEGRAPQLSASIAGSGSLRAAHLKTQAANVSVMGSGEATVWAAAELNASVAGSGAVRYYGSPRVRSATAGSGSAERLGPSPS